MKFLKSKKTTKQHKATDAAAGWIAAGIQKIQHKWARAMTKLFSKLSPSWVKGIMVGCFLLMAGYSTLLVASAFSRPLKLFENTVTLLKEGPVAKPLYSKETLPDKIPGRIRKFRHYIDSLARSTKGRRVRDSLLKKRPGLLDSLQRIEEIYCR